MQYRSRSTKTTPAWWTIHRRQAPGFSTHTHFEVVSLFFPFLLFFILHIFCFFLPLSHIHLSFPFANCFQNHPYFVFFSSLPINTLFSPDTFTSYRPLVFRVCTLVSPPALPIVAHIIYYQSHSRRLADTDH